MKDNIVYLKHILGSIKNIEEYISGFDFESFSNDKKTVAAVIRELEIIGEASNNLSDEFKAGRPEIPFRDITDMRNILAHEYFGVNKKVVWNTATEDLKNLKEIIEAYLGE